LKLGLKTKSEEYWIDEDTGKHVDEEILKTIKQLKLIIDKCKLWSGVPNKRREKMLISELINYIEENNIRLILKLNNKQGS